MLALVILICSLGAVDSLNPATLAIAAYLASTREPRRRLAGFALGVFSVYLLGGVALLLGAGQLLDAIAGARNSPAIHIMSVLAGVAGIALAATALARRSRAATPRLPAASLTGASAMVLGAVVTVIDLPTAFPYFAAIVAITGSGLPLAGQLLLLIVFNGLYVLPLVLLLGAHLLLGERWEPALARLRPVLARIAAPAAALVVAATGVALIAHGTSGLAA